MQILFVHNNFPAQFVHLARHLARDPKVRLVAISASTARKVPGVNVMRYPPINQDVAASHPFARRFELECRRAEQVLYALSSLRSSGFVPDVIIAHPGWGETLPLRTIFPKARLIVYCEFFYGHEGRDVSFDPEFPDMGADGHVGLQLKNSSTLLALSECDVGVAPTEWQRSTFPAGFGPKIRVVHEGVDVDVARPDPAARVALPRGGTLSRQDEVVTFVARNLEPLRGFHVFMRALPRILAARPRAHVLIVGGDGVSYGMPPPRGQTWRSTFLKEVEARLDMSRVHFLGALPYERYLDVLNVSSAHVYLTYPFVLSWSLIEALSCGCAVIGSDTPPLREVIDGSNGLLVPFFDKGRLADSVIEALASPSRVRSLRLRARETALERFDMARRCLPQMLDIVRGGRSEPAIEIAPRARPEHKPSPRLYPGTGGKQSAVAS